MKPVGYLTSICQRAHTCIVVSCVVDCVNTNCVQTELRKFGNISGAGRLICEGVDGLGWPPRLIVDTTNVKAVGTSKESYAMLDYASMWFEAKESHIPLPETVTLVRDFEDERATSSSVGVGFARTMLAPASAANLLNPFIFFFSSQILADRMC